MQRIPTNVHGILDYASVGVLLALPRLLGWNAGVTRLLTSSALLTLGYSLLTRYELGVVKVLPMPAHLSLDIASGITLCSAPLLFDTGDRQAAAALVGLGLFEIVAPLLSATDQPAPRAIPVV